MNPTLSVIIPVYKVENYLERCVKSVLNQDFRDLEVILVDDGSPDRCPQICDEIAQSDERVTVVHKPNGGLSSARNKGIDMARGKYLAFLDSDDQWAEGQLTKLMNQIGSADIDMVVFDFINIYDGNIQKKRYEGDFYANDFVIYDKIDYYKRIISYGDLRESACTKFFSREFILANQLFFCLGITGEDTEWMLRFLRVARKIAVSNVVLFLCTCGRMGSIQNSIRAKNIYDIIGTIDKSLAYCETHPDSLTNQYELEHCSYLVSNAIGLLIHIKQTQEKKELLVLLKAKSYLLNYSSNRKTRKISMVYKIFGFRVLVKFLMVYMFLKKKNLINNGKTIN